MSPETIKKFHLRFKKKRELKRLMVDDSNNVIIFTKEDYK